MAKKQKQETIAITLRLPVRVLVAYDEVAKRANMNNLKSGGKGGLSSQDVIRHRLASLPFVKLLAKGE